MFGTTWQNGVEMGGRVVVGVDGSERSLAALRWAAADARRRDATLECVMCWHDVAGARLAGRTEAHVGGALHKTLTRAGLTEIDDLEVLETTAEGSPGPTLCKVAYGADLLVVAARGHGKLAGVALGSVSMHCVTHAPCPVVVVRD
jgi:nucleotide-binding universal stress UspA family protein